MRCPSRKHVRTPRQEVFRDADGSLHSADFLGLELLGLAKLMAWGFEGPQSFCCVFTKFTLSWGFSPAKSSTSWCPFDVKGSQPLNPHPEPQTLSPGHASMQGQLFALQQVPAICRGRFLPCTVRQCGEILLSAKAYSL